MDSILNEAEVINADDPLALTRILDLPELQVVRRERDPRRQRLYLHCRLTNDLAQCPHCGALSAHVHQTRLRTVRDLPWAGWACYLQLPRRRFWCDRCRRPFTETLPAVAPYARITCRYADLVVACCRTSTIQQVARAEQHGYHAVEGLFYRQASTLHPEGPPAHLVRRLGLDEIAARKGHGQFRLVVVDLDSGCVLTQLPNREKETLRAYLLSWPAPQREAVEEVAVDFWADYHDVAAEVLPGARVVGDRFHVQKHLNAAVNKTRLGVQRRLRGEDREFVRTWRDVLLRNEEDLPAANWTMLTLLKVVLPVLDRVHTLKEEFRTIFNTAADKEAAVVQLREWLVATRASGIAALVEFAGFVERWWEAILNYFVQGTTSGVVEGLNNKIKLIKRLAFGFRSDEHFRLRVRLACDGSD